MMTPINLEYLDKYSSLPSADMTFINDVRREIATNGGAHYVDYLAVPDLYENMRHYDGMTGDGHKIMGKMLSNDLLKLLEFSREAE